MCKVHERSIFYNILVVMKKSGTEASQGSDNHETNLVESW